MGVEQEEQEEQEQTAAEAKGNAPLGRSRQRRGQEGEGRGVAQQVVVVRVAAILTAPSASWYRKLPSPLGRRATSTSTRYYTNRSRSRPRTFDAADKKTNTRRRMCMREARVGWVPCSQDTWRVHVACVLAVLSPMLAPLLLKSLQRFSATAVLKFLVHAIIPRDIYIQYAPAIRLSNTRSVAAGTQAHTHTSFD